MVNPFIGEGESKNTKIKLPIENYEENSDDTPLELTDEFCTQVFPIKAKTIRLNPVLMLSEKEVPASILQLPDDMTFYLDFRKHWQALREDTRKKLETMSVEELEVPVDSYSLFAKNLEDYTDEIQNMLLTTAHFKPALESAVDSVSKLLERITGSVVDSTGAGSIRAMLSDSINAKFLEFFTKTFELPEDTISLLRAKYFQGEVTNYGRELSNLQTLLKMLISKQK